MLAASHKQQDHPAQQLRGTETVGDCTHGVGRADADALALNGRRVGAALDDSALPRHHMHCPADRSVVGRHQQAVEAIAICKRLRLRVPS